MGDQEYCRFTTNGDAMIEFEYKPKTNKVVLRSGCSDVFDDIREHFSVVNEGAHFARRAGARFVSSRKYAITPSGQMMAGMYDEVKKYLITKQITKVSYSAEFEEYLNVGFKYSPYDDFTPPYKLRYYQKDLLTAAISNGRGVCILGTGGGKTLICASLVQSYYNNATDRGSFKCLIIVPTIDLVNQTFNDFTEYGVDFTYTKWKGGTDPDPGASVVIANASILTRRHKLESSRWMKFVDLLVVDEVHGLADANKITNIVSGIHTTHKYGFTGTLPEDQMAKWNIIGAIGPVLYEKSSSELRVEGYLTNATVRCLEVSYKTSIIGGKANPYYDELDFLYHNPYRNNLIKSICKKYNKNILILVNHIDHGVELLRVLSALDRPVYFIRGDVEVSERERIIQEMEASEGVICISISKIFSTGINVKNLHMLIFASGGKSFIRTVQAIGRGLRRHTSKQMFNIIDFCDKLSYGTKHATKRREIYNKEKIPYKTVHVEEQVEL